MLQSYLDTLIITPDNIGGIRRALFRNESCEWNSWVRDETAARENFKKPPESPSVCHPGSWIGVDLDGTLAYYDGWVSLTHIGEPIGQMVDRIKAWLATGQEVRIFTARLGERQTETERVLVSLAINRWCERHIGHRLPITATKDLKMYELWDDRCVCVERNTGRILGRNP